MAPHTSPDRSLGITVPLYRSGDWGYGLFSHFRIGTRLTAMMVVAAVVAVLLATLGIQGLATSNESLRQVYEERMKPMQALAHISHLMLANRLQLQIALREAAAPSDPAVARGVADTLQRNMEDIDQLWRAHQAQARTHNPQEYPLAERFIRRREQYVVEAIQPAIQALRALAYRDVSAPASRAQALYESTNTEIQALINLQLDAAQATYGAGMQRYQQTWWISISALLTAMALLSLLGVLLIRSLVRPLRHVIQVFRHIESGKLDTPIDLRGSDEISDVMRALQTLQVTLDTNAKAIHQLAYYDPLTQLPNRRLLRERMEAALLASGQDIQHRALLLLDLDNFKTINDTQGHEVGDQLLVEVAQSLRSVIGERGTIARLGGDEFVILLNDLPAQESSAREHVKHVAQQLLTILKKPSTLAGHIQRTSASIGICLFQRNNATAKDLLKRADVAMYQAKADGRNGFCFFNPAMQAQLDARTALQCALHGAVDAGQFQLHFQLQVNAQRQALGAEVLLRWTHPQFGSISPGVFIPIAEDSGLILVLGEWVLQQACLQLKRWEDSALTSDLVLAVNVSARQFSHPDFVTQVQGALQHSGANPARLVLELTESLVLQDIADTINTMQMLRRQGVRFSLDDFGTGYSSLSHLKQLPLYQLKIDGSFVQDIVTDPSDQAMVQTMVDMAHNLGMDVIAEGVETEAQRQALLRLDCPTYQGYLFARPLPLAQFEQSLEQQATRAASATSSISPPSTPALPMRA
ncbi:putative bifunctional diguanylate cyclase/phosphodiesterase [Simplicispira psychrophila]|uniref:putative bifunctional diguanylate cyclase/phosphodiesterase n=1 Tax=Simplicispira psychrophila TaxID=80882 RepID=UPI000A067DA2|nr:EAL domain-containing protein [Simplicispira psychrophila]